jgi:hypothetical protein
MLVLVLVLVLDSIDYWLHVACRAGTSGTHYSLQL